MVYDAHTEARLRSAAESVPAVAPLIGLEGAAEILWRPGKAARRKRPHGSWDR
jgi:hypothetical protein